jgi:hypothetical protein
MAKDILKQYTSLQASLLNELKHVETRAQDIRDALKSGSLDGGEIPVPFVKSAKRRGRKPKVMGKTPVPSDKGTGRRKGKITTTDAIIQSLANGQLGVPAIVDKVSELKGKVSKASINQGLNQLKKKGAILNPSRGQYALKK